MYAIRSYYGNVVALDSMHGLLRKGIGMTVHIIVTVEEPVPLLPPELQAKLVSKQSGQLEFKLDRGVESIVEFLDRLRHTDIAITDLRTEEPDLEDVFLELTGEAAE